MDLSRKTVVLNRTKCHNVYDNLSGSFPNSIIRESADSLLVDSHKESENKMTKTATTIDLQAKNYNKELKSTVNQVVTHLELAGVDKKVIDEARLSAELQFRSEHKQIGGQHSDFLDSANLDIHNDAQSLCDEINATSPIGKDSVSVVYNVVASKKKDSQ